MDDTFILSSNIFLMILLFGHDDTRHLTGVVTRQPPAARMVQSPYNTAAATSAAMGTKRRRIRQLHMMREIRAMYIDIPRR